MAAESGGAVDCRLLNFRRRRKEQPKDVGLEFHRDLGMLWILRHFEAQHSDFRLIPENITVDNNLVTSNSNRICKNLEIGNNQKTIQSEVPQTHISNIQIRTL